MRHYILPVLGDVALADIDTPTVTVWLDTLSRRSEIFTA
jgi:hypothetical protein